VNGQNCPIFSSALVPATITGLPSPDEERTHTQSIARLQPASTIAVSVLVKTMVDPTAPHSTRVRAADSVLDHAKKAIEIEDIEVRVAALEETTGRDQKK
jgi:hypothetical protein